MEARNQRGLAPVTWGIFAGVVMLVAFALVLTYGWLSTPQFCNTCHIMSTRYAGWHRSGHVGNATCIQCHSEPGTFGEFKAHLSGARYLWAIVTGRQTSDVLRSEVGDATCIECHAVDQMRTGFEPHDPDHGLHRSLGVTCTRCHDNVSHGRLFGGPSEAPMKQCPDCHTTLDRVSMRCQGCHFQPGYTIDEKLTVPQKQGRERQLFPEFSPGFRP